MEHAVRNIDLQFDYRPTIENKNSLRPAGSFVVGGMGGSHLAADLLRVFKPDLDMYIHQDYGLPVLAQRKFSTSLYIASSYSGNTEETLDFAEKAHAAGFNLAVISTGGLLIDFARKNHVPYIQLPDTGIQPRGAIGYSLLAFAALIGDEGLISDLHVLGLKLKKDRIEKSDELEKRGAVLAYEMRGKVPVVYASRKNWALAYNWKIKFNETAKIPAFCNVLPELNHNEMTGFDVVPGTSDLCSKFFFIFLGDDTDSPAIKHRMEVLKNLYRKRRLDGIQVAFSQSTPYAQVFESLLLADWTAISLSKMYGTEPEKVPMVEEFKRLMKQ